MRPGTSSELGLNYRLDLGRDIVRAGDAPLQAPEILKDEMTWS